MSVTLKQGVFRNVGNIHDDPGITVAVGHVMRFLKTDLEEFMGRLSYVI